MYVILHYTMPTYVVGVAGGGVAKYIPVLPEGQAKHAPLALHVGQEVAAVVGGQVQLLDDLTLQITYWVYIYSIRMYIVYKMVIIMLLIKGNIHMYRISYM